jgi:hypothetical protein
MFTSKIRHLMEEHAASTSGFNIWNTDILPSIEASCGYNYIKYYHAIAFEGGRVKQCDVRLSETEAPIFLEYLNSQNLCPQHIYTRLRKLPNKKCEKAIVKHHDYDDVIFVFYPDRFLEIFTAWNTYFSKHGQQGLLWSLAGDMDKPLTAISKFQEGLNKRRLDAFMHLQTIVDKLNSGNVDFSR